MLFRLLRFLPFLTLSSLGLAPDFCLLLLQLRELGLHLAVDPHGRVAALEEVIIDLGDAAGAVFDIEQVQMAQLFLPVPNNDGPADDLPALHRL